MSSTEPGTQPARTPLTRERVLLGAIELADADGISGLTIRSLAQHLGVKPMAIYHHVAGKDEILDGIVDAVFAEIELPAAGGDWRAELGRRARSARSVLVRHAWAIGLLDSRTSPGPATLRHHDAVIGALRSGGLSPAMTAHAFTLLDSYIYGFAVQEAALPVEASATVAATVEEMAQHLDRDAYPHLAALTTEHLQRPDYDFGAEFDFGLELILDGLAKAGRTG